ncbi:hypothetical protein GTW43_33795 [Streptomyces sp. SID5785]|uniref:hypothetical protein n=1 Tax=Streptomyces sp. SID5785 TaxID=2690309 RepID=UPI001360BFB6|nr:hypothetical protein [Streptomyces sp. SID5785]MZD10018.1 hypothetical protein [Streptomyces sp. SID5785]
MAWDEWEQLKAAAEERQAGQMRLDSAGSSSAGPQGDLTVSHSDLAKIGDEAFQLFQDLGNHGRDAWASSQSAASDLKTQGFEIGGGLDKVQERWEKQLQSVLDACAHISNHMDFTQKAHKGDEYYIAGAVSSIAQLDKGFSEDDKKFSGKGEG